MLESHLTYAKLFVVCLAITASALLAATGVASAATTTTGTPGAVALVQTGGSGGGFTNLISTSGIKVYRSTAVSGTQRITVRFTLSRWVNGTWNTYQTFVHADQYLLSGMVGSFADQSLTFNDYGYYRSTCEIWWRQPSGSTFAYRKTVYDLNDYYCIGWLATNCDVGTGWIHLGI
jgi:hypothetical protein